MSKKARKIVKLKARVRELEAENFRLRRQIDPEYGNTLRSLIPSLSTDRTAIPYLRSPSLTFGGGILGPGRPLAPIVSEAPRVEVTAPHLTPEDVATIVSTVLADHDAQLLTRLKAN